ncbi:MAG: tetratricopeptide repeat protein [bacterium]
MQKKSIRIFLAVICLVLSYAVMALAADNFSAKQIELIKQGDKYLAERNVDGALKAYDQALALGKTGQDIIYLKKVVVYGVQGKIKEAQQACESAIKANPKNPDGYYNLGEIQAVQKNNAEAEKNFKKALSLAPKDLEINWRLAQFYLDIQQNDKAIAQGKAALSIAPNDLNSNWQMTKLYLVVGKSDLAEGQAKKMVSLEPKNPSAHQALAQTYLYLKKNDLAFKSAKDIQALNAKDPNYQWMAALIYLQGDNLKAAKEAFGEVVKLDDQAVPAYAYLGQIAYAEKDYKEAINQWNNIIKIAPDNIPALLSISNAYKQMGDKKNCKAYAEKVLKLDPKNEAAKELTK